MSLKKIARWIGRRLKERSTYVGIGAVAVAVGAPPSVVEAIGTAGQIALVVLGTGLATATTSVHTPEPEQ